VVKLQAWTTPRSSKKWDPSAMRGPSTATAKGATSGGAATSTAGGRGLNMAGAPDQSRHCHRQGQRCGQGTSRCQILKDQSRGGPWGGTVFFAPHQRPEAQRTSCSGCPDGRQLWLILAAQGAPLAFLPSGSGSSDGGEGGGIHGAGELSFFLGSEVALEASGVQRRLQ
jgi:hypothetical protein